MSLVKGADSSGGLLRAATPNPGGESSSVETTKADNDSLRRCASIISDLRAMEKRVLSLWQDEISVLLPHETEIGESDTPLDGQLSIQIDLQSLRPTDQPNPPSSPTAAQASCISAPFTAAGTTLARRRMLSTPVIATT